MTVEAHFQVKFGEKYQYYTVEELISIIEALHNGHVLLDGAIDDVLGGEFEPSLRPDERAVYALSELAQGGSSRGTPRQLLAPSPRAREAREDRSGPTVLDDEHENRRTRGLERGDLLPRRER